MSLTISSEEEFIKPQSKQNREKNIDVYLNLLQFSNILLTTTGKPIQYHAYWSWSSQVSRPIGINVA